MERNVANAVRGSQAPCAKGPQQQLSGASNKYLTIKVTVALHYYVSKLLNMRIIHRCHTRSQCPIVCQVVTGVIPSSPYLALTLIFRFGATYVGASKIISMQVCGQKKYLQ